MEENEIKNNISPEPQKANPVETIQALETKTASNRKLILGTLSAVLILLLIGGALALGYLWGNNANQPSAPGSETQSASSAVNNNSSTSQSSVAADPSEGGAPPDSTSEQSRNETLDPNYFYVSDWNLKIKKPDAIFSYATDGQYRIYVWGHKSIQGEQAVPPQGNLSNWDDTIVNPVFLGMIETVHCDYEDCSNTFFQFDDAAMGKTGLVYRESTTAAEKYAASYGGSSEQVADDAEMLKEHFSNPVNYVVVE